MYLINNSSDIHSYTHRGVVFRRLIEKFCVVMVSTWVLLPQVTGNSGFYYFAFFFLIWLFLSSFNSNLTKVNIRLFQIVLFVLYSVMLEVFGKGNSLLYPKLVSVGTFFIGALIYNYYIKKKEYKFLAFLCLINLLFMAYTAINTIKVLSINPYLSRGLSSQNDVYIDLLKLGITGYGYIYGLVLLAPCLLLFILGSKSLGKKRLFLLWGLFGVFTLVILKASFTIAVIFFMLNIILTWSISGRKRFIIVCMLLLAFILIPKENLANIITNEVNTIDNYEYKMRILSISDFLFKGGSLGESGDTRLWLYHLSYKTFVNNPLIGVGSYYGDVAQMVTQGIGGHSEWLDLLARYGLIGSFPVFLFFFTTLKFIYNNMFQYSYYKKVIWIMTLFIVMLGSINPILSAPELGYTLFLIVPSLPYLNLLNKNTDKTN
ncbi:hypothetical protein [Neobacillus sp.]|uniref:hypothetical protein n=1 Tax=Neobacillus sp. TaxID=2675273 RepID=UPI00289F0577|nr:hypothetical protein [Neobacillus sp.]